MKQKTLLNLWLLLFALIVGSGNAWADSYEIVFKTAAADSNSELGASPSVSDVVDSGTDYVASFSSCSKIYVGASGVKLGSSKATGTINFSLASSYQANIKSIKVVSAKYGSDTGTLTLYSGSTSLKSGITPGTDYTHTFDSPTTVSSIKIVTSAKRAYITKIVLTTEAAISTHALTYSATNGSISGVDAESNSVSSGDDVAEEATVTLTATPSSGYEFSNWEVSGTGASLSSTSTNPTTFTMGTADATVTANFVASSTVATPTFSVAGGTYNAAQSVTISCATDDATIYYTLDGTDPTTSSSVYSSAVSITATKTLKAFAVKDGLTNSSIASATYTLKCATPAISLDAGAVYYGTETSISCATDGASIHYTTDGATPTSSSTTYSSSIAINSAQTIKAIAVKDGWTASDVASAAYTIKNPAVPTFSIAAGAVVRNTVVTISSAAGTTIYYTTDGSDADTGTDAESNSVNVTIDAAKTIKAIAVDPVLNMSSEVSASYTIVQVATPTFSPVAGMITKGSTVTLSCATEGATIHYTRDGSTPTSSSPTYSSAITINFNQTIKAIAVKDNYIDSEVASASYTISDGNESVTFADVYKNNDLAETVNGTDVSYTFALGSGSSDPKYYDTGSAVRMYQNNTLTIASSTKTIVSIQFTFASSYGTLALVSGQPGTLGDLSSNKRTWTGSASSVKFTTSAANRLQAITVYYAGTDTRTACVTSLDLSTKTFSKDDTGTLTKTGTEDGDLTEDLIYTFSSDDDDVIEVLEDGTYEAKAVGTATVTVTASPAEADIDDYKPVTTEVEVSVTTTNTLAIDKTSASTKYGGSDVTITATPATGYDGTITANSSNTDIATVSVDGTTITVSPGTKVGKATITITAPTTSLYVGSSVARTCEVTVNQPEGDTEAPDPNVVFATLNFASNTWDLPTDYTTTTDNYTSGDYTVTIAGEYKFSSSYTMLKSGSTLTLPTFAKDVTKIDVVGNSGASTKTKENIYVGTTTVSTETTGSTGTSSFIINSSYQTAGTIYKLQVTEANAQITAIKVYTSSTITQKLNAYGYATFCSQYPLDFSDWETAGYSAWQITDIDESAITFSQIKGKIKGGQGILLKGTASTTVTITSDDSDTELSDNLLEGTLAPTVVVANEYFGLSGNKFLRVNAGTVPAGKALLPASVVPDEARELTFLFLDDEVTGIRTIDNGKMAMDKNAVYDLSGRRVQNPKHGLYIVNGKKVIIK